MHNVRSKFRGTIQAIEKVDDSVTKREMWLVAVVRLSYFLPDLERPLPLSPPEAALSRSAFKACQLDTSSNAAAQHACIQAAIRPPGEHVPLVPPFASA